MSRVLLTVEGVKKRFGERELLKGAGVQLEAGNGYVLTGGNGTGKTTFLRILAGLEAAEAGRLTFRGHAAGFDAYPENFRREILYVHQQPYLFRTGLLENIEYGLACRGVSTEQRRSKAVAALTWAGLSDRQTVPPQKLSGGEKQRAALARARVLEPTLMLLDEPTANLDGEARKQVLELVTSLCTESHTVLIATHDPEIIRLAILNRLLIEDGRIVAEE
jgi:tungstate transport system ATP-binding protein